MSQENNLADIPKAQPVPELQLARHSHNPHNLYICPHKKTTAPWLLLSTLLLPPAPASSPGSLATARLPQHGVASRLAGARTASTSRWACPRSLRPLTGPTTTLLATTTDSALRLPLSTTSRWLSAHLRSVFCRHVDSRCAYTTHTYNTHSTALLNMQRIFSTAFIYTAGLENTPLPYITTHFCTIRPLTPLPAHCNPPAIVRTSGAGMWGGP